MEKTRCAIDNMEILSRYDEIFKMALKYIYLVAGRLAEVYGEHAPRVNDVFIHKIEGEDAVIFLVKTARRKGNSRVIAIPRVSDPWAVELYDFFIASSNENPFDIGHVVDTSRKYLQNRSSELFDSLGHVMRRASYSRIEKKDASDRVIDEESREGKMWYLIEYPNRERLWHDEKVLKNSYREIEQPKKFRIKHLREQREKELRGRYRFSDEQARAYLGLKQGKQETNLIRYDRTEPKDGIFLQEVISIAETYFSKFR